MFCISSALVMRVLSEASPPIKAVCAVAAACMVGARFAADFRSLCDAAERLVEGAAVGGGYLLTVFKCLGICFVTQLGCDICRDCGENALASQLELAGRVAVLISALPLFTAAAETVRLLLDV